METTVLAAVLAVAATTALLNCSMKAASDPLAAALMLAIGGGAVAAVTLPLTGLPAAESLPCLAASALIGVFYWSFLGRAYASGDVGIVFPLAFGIAPAMILLATALLLSEIPSLGQLLVILLIVSGLLLIMGSGLDTGNHDKRRLAIHCLAVAACVTAYTIIDGVGARLSGSAFAYAALLYLANGLAVLVYALAFHRRRILSAGPAAWRTAVFWGAASMLIYTGEIWAMTRAPIAMVAALRESSIVFVILFAVLWLREPARAGRFAGVGVVAIGLVLIKAV